MCVCVCVRVHERVCPVVVSVWLLVSHEKLNQLPGGEALISRDEGCMGLSVVSLNH